MSWRLCTRAARLFVPACALRLEWQLPHSRRLFQSLAADPSIGPPARPPVSADSSNEAASPSPTLDELKYMAAIKTEVLQLQKLLGLVPPDDNQSLSLKELKGLVPGKRAYLKDVVFVCIDCEAYEFAQSKITEIGVSILDTRSIKDVNPDEDGSPWFKLMKHIHLRPIEYKKLVNKRYIKGCPEAFNFGKSQFVRLNSTGNILNRIFNDPTRILEAVDFKTKLPLNHDVDIILVGHDLSNDTKYMQQLNFRPNRDAAGSFDTQRLARLSKKESPGLKKLLAALSIDAENLHNAGNDAAYTLQALVGLAVQEHHRPGALREALIKVNAEFAAERQAMKVKRPAPKELETVCEGASGGDGELASEVVDGEPASKKQKIDPDDRDSLRTGETA